MPQQQSRLNHAGGTRASKQPRAVLSVGSEPPPESGERRYSTTPAGQVASSAVEVNSCKNNSCCKPPPESGEWRYSTNSRAPTAAPTPTRVRGWLPHLLHTKQGVVLKGEQGSWETSKQRFQSSTVG